MEPDGLFTPDGLRIFDSYDASRPRPFAVGHAGSYTIYN